MLYVQQMEVGGVWALDDVDADCTGVTKSWRQRQFYIAAATNIASANFTHSRIRVHGWWI